ncbi:hypothetical protein AB433_04600 [Croceicoccus naphthovorans]|uniref:Uncharacterized protein n=1 Tax=Croceicoccus naphthovorans TaxID=1348774 RepID=A0A0G3XFN2_9SPHN|nr:hypothetical protein AB433_04600 [Croceicoccus naphthovorans]
MVGLLVGSRTLRLLPGRAPGHASERSGLGSGGRFFAVVGVRAVTLQLAAKSSGFSISAREISELGMAEGVADAICIASHVRLYFD